MSAAKKNPFTAATTVKPPPASWQSSGAARRLGRIEILRPDGRSAVKLLGPNGGLLSEVSSSDPAELRMIAAAYSEAADRLEGVPVSDG